MLNVDLVGCVSPVLMLNFELVGMRKAAGRSCASPVRL